MAANLTEPQTTAAMAAASTGLRSIMADVDIPLALQAQVYHAGFTKEETFAVIGTSAQEIRDMLRDDFHINHATSLANRATVATILACWEAVKGQVQVQNQAKAE